MKKRGRSTAVTSNSAGRWRKNGVADPLLWIAIESKIERHPEWSSGEVASSLSCSISTVEKIKRRLRNGEATPRKHGTGERHRKMAPHHVQVMVELLSIEEKGEVMTIADVQQHLSDELGVQWARSTLNQNLLHEHSRQKATFEDLVNGALQIAACTKPSCSGA